MPEGAFFEQKRASPTGFAVVVLMHAAVLGAVMLMKGPVVIRHLVEPTLIDFIEVEPDPPPVVPPPEPERQLPQPPVVDRFPPIVDRPPTGPVLSDRPRMPPTPIADAGRDLPPVREIPPPPPVRVEAEVDPRHAGALQPPYPASEQRAEREGQVRIRVTIGTDGRVKAAERLSATNEAFWSVTERQALSRWRFRPATLDGRPVESRKVMTVRFRLEA